MNQPIIHPQPLATGRVTRAATLGFMLAMAAPICAAAEQDPAIHAAKNDLALTPPMGCFPWNIFANVDLEIPEDK